MAAAAAPSAVRPLAPPPPPSRPDPPIATDERKGSAAASRPPPPPKNGRLRIRPPLRLRLRLRPRLALLASLLWVALTVPALYRLAATATAGTGNAAGASAPPRDDGGSPPPPPPSPPPRSVRVLSYSVFGSDPSYALGMISSARLASVTFPGWEVRVYHDGGWDGLDGVPDFILSDLSDLPNVRLVNATDPGDGDGDGDGGGGVVPRWARRVNPMVWRFLPASDPSVDAFGVRDSDSRPTERERSAVDEWLRSGRSFHVMHDHPAHHFGRYAPMMGGMWGARGGAVPDMEERIRSWYAGRDPAGRDSKKVTARYSVGDDQRFLAEVVWPLARNDSLHHDSYYCRESGGVAFPMSREEAGSPLGFVGQPYEGESVFSTERRGNDRTTGYQDWLLNERYLGMYRDCLELRRGRGKNITNVV